LPSSSSCRQAKQNEREDKQPKGVGAPLQKKDFPIPGKKIEETELARAPYFQKSERGDRHA
jgi:hypothetical protein